MKVVDGPGGEIRYIVFNFDTQPYGATTAGGRPGQGPRRPPGRGRPRRPRGDREAGLQGHLLPAVLLRPRGLHRCHRGAQGPLRRRRRRTRMPTRRRRRSRRPASPPRSQLNLQYNQRPLRPVVGRRVRGWSSRSSRRAACSPSTSSRPSGSSTRRTARRTSTPSYQLGWFPDYSDADNYLTPFFLKTNFLEQPLRQRRGAGSHPRSRRSRPTRRHARRTSSRSRASWRTTSRRVPLLQGNAGRESSARRGRGHPRRARSSSATHR